MKTLTPEAHFNDPAFPFYICRIEALGNHPRHRHAFFEFFLLTEGQLSHVIDGKQRLLAQGDIVMLSPSHDHAIKPVAGKPAGSLQVIFMPAVMSTDPAFLRKNRDLTELIFMAPFYEDGCMVFRLSGKSLLKVKTLLEEMLVEFTERQKGYRTAIRAKLTDLLITITRTYDKARPSHPEQRKNLSGTAEAILNSLTFIDTHFVKELTLEEVAARTAGVTKEYFSTVFHNMTGTTFTAYIAGLRVARAKELLTATDQKIINVCFDAGFNDLSHFNKTFKKLTGVTPSRFRRAAGRDRS